MACCKNVGGVDRVIRGVLGAALIAAAVFALGLTQGAVAGIVALVTGVILLGTAAVGICPLYMPFKLATCKVAR
ncbi:MAG: DUF2892 domain-containing protein [Phycisphaerales bacterium]|jgi:hypothetical protein|nr:DUF2892 domain-containing protein [Phycisphaerales bacterium]